VVVAMYLAAATWALFSSDIHAFIAALPWSYVVASGPWEGAVAVALFIPCIILNAVLIYVCVAPFLRFTAATFGKGNRG
jgi:hypothetical protein